MEKRVMTCTQGIKGRKVEDRMEKEDKVRRRLSAQLTDSSTPPGMNTRKVYVCMYACGRACVYVSVLIIYHVSLSKGLSLHADALRKC